MAEKIKLSGVPETMLQTVYARAKESTGRGVIQDKKALEIIDELDYDFSLADKDTAMRSGVIARTLVLDRLVGAWLAKKFRCSGSQHSLRTGYPMLSDAWVFLLVQPGLAADHGCSGKTAAGKRYDLTDCYVCHGRLGQQNCRTGCAGTGHH